MAFIGLPNSQAGDSSFATHSYRGATNGRTEFFTRAFIERTEANPVTETFVHTGAGVVMNRPAWGQLWPRGAK